LKIHIWTVGVAKDSAYLDIPGIEHMPIDFREQLKKTFELIFTNGRVVVSDEREGEDV
jgi:hypothetical protein